jgi:hypothetical protein
MCALIRSFVSSTPLLPGEARPDYRNARKNSQKVLKVNANQERRLPATET